MPDLPEEAVQAATAAITNLSCEHEGFCFECEARAALEAAAPVLAAQARAQALRDAVEGKVTLEEHTAAQGVTAPQRIEDLHTDLDLTDEEMEAFMAALDEPDVGEEEIRADERRKIAEEIRAITKDDGGLKPPTRQFIDRHPRLFQGSSMVAVLLAVADEIEGDACDRLRAALPERTTDA
jgi:hypothetical protein